MSKYDELSAIFDQLSKQVPMSGKTTATQQLASHLGKKADSIKENPCKQIKLWDEEAYDVHYKAAHFNPKKEFPQVVIPKKEYTSPYVKDWIAKEEQLIAHTQPFTKIIEGTPIYSKLDFVTDAKLVDQTAPPPKRPTNADFNKAVNELLASDKYKDRMDIGPQSISFQPYASFGIDLPTPEPVTGTFNISSNGDTTVKSVDMSYPKPSQQGLIYVDTTGIKEGSTLEMADGVWKISKPDTSEVELLKGRVASLEAANQMTNMRLEGAEKAATLLRTRVAVAESNNTALAQANNHLHNIVDTVREDIRSLFDMVYTAERSKKNSKGLFARLFSRFSGPKAVETLIPDPLA